MVKEQIINLLLEKDYKVHEFTSFLIVGSKSLTSIIYFHFYENHITVNRTPIYYSDPDFQRKLLESLHDPTPE